MHNNTQQIKVQHISLDDLDEDQSDLFSKMEASYDTELFLRTLDNWQLSLLFFLRYLGYSYKEIIKIMKLKNVGQYYALVKKLQVKHEKFCQE